MPSERQWTTGQAVADSYGEVGGTVGSGDLPEDPAGFVARAEEITNRRDLEGAVGVYAPDAVLRTVTDGASETHRGRDAIEAAWRVYLSALDAHEFRLRKHLLVAASGRIVNDWQGMLGKRSQARGIEYWVFDCESRVREHWMYSFLNVKPSTSGVQRVRLLLAYPGMATSFLRARARQTRRNR